MSEEEEYRHVYDFIGNHSYPTGFSKNEKRILRRKCQEHFCVSLHVVKKQKMTRSGGKLPDLLKTERESCSPVTLKMKVNLPQSLII